MSTARAVAERIAELEGHGFTRQREASKQPMPAVEREVLVQVRTQHTGELVHAYGSSVGALTERRRLFESGCLELEGFLVVVHSERPKESREVHDACTCLMEAE